MAIKRADYNDLRLELWLRQRERDEIRWVTKEGTEIPIREMSDSHLANAMACLQRQSEMEAAMDEAVAGYMSEDWYV